MTKRYNPRRSKPGRSYTIGEAAALFEINQVTIYKWFHAGLERVDKKRPVLIHGSKLRAFVAALNKPRCPLLPGEIYCVACRGPRRPAGDKVTTEPRGPTTVDIVGTCSGCGRTIYRRARIAELHDKIGTLQLAS